MLNVPCCIDACAATHEEARMVYNEGSVRRTLPQT